MMFCFVKGGEGYWYTAGADDTLFFLIIVGQIAVAIVLSVVLLIRTTRRNRLWLIIPLILIGFALLYDPILRLIWDKVYPCC
jgi:uncharacterized protein (DUF983 family)